MILIDTSVWARFFKGLDEAKFAGDKARENTALLHPLVLGELLLGGLSKENELLLQALTAIQLPTTEKVYRFIKDNSLPGKSIGWVYAAILCSAYEAGTVLATFDEALRTCAGDIGIACVPIG
ncbi:Ribonuclease VapC32 [subsurface metagenome]